MKRKIYLIDANNFIYRMFFGLPEFSTKDGKVVNAIFWMAKFFTNQLVKEKPDYVYVVKDAKGDNFRHELFSDYKATRERMPDNLRSQISDIEKLIELLKFPLIEIPGFEADDAIGSLAKILWEDKENDVFILTWDKDLYSLVSENVKIYDTMKKKVFWIEETREKFGIEPEMIIDYLAIMWDKADNIPWIDWFWPKKAVTLINDIWSIEKVYEVLDSWNYEDLTDDAKKLFRWKAIEKLEASRENAFLSKKLATIALDMDSVQWLSLDDHKFTPEKLFSSDVITMFQDYEFESLIPQDNKKAPDTWKDLNISPKIIWDSETLFELESLMNNYSEIVLDTETTSLDIMEAELVWVSIYLDDENVYYINRGHRGPQVKDKDLQLFLTNLLQKDVTIIGHNIKYDLQILELYLNNAWNNSVSQESQDSQSTLF